MLLQFEKYLNTNQQKPTNNEKKKMKLNKLATAATALAAAALLASSAKATTVSYTNGDLLIGFEQKGVSTDYVVDLGSVTNLINATAPVTFNLSTTDLVADFGSGWAANSNGATNVQWGVVGNDQNGTISPDQDGTTIWLTKGESTAGTKSTPITAKDEFALGPISQNIQNFETASSGGFKNSTSTSDTTNAINESTSTDSNAWGNFGPGTYSPSKAGQGFGSGASVEQPSTGLSTGPTDSVLDLYQLNASDEVPSSQAVEFLGTFNLGSGGVLTFNPAAVPEPSAYALGITALILFAVLKRRNSLAQA